MRGDARGRAERAIPAHTPERDRVASGRRLTHRRGADRQGAARLRARPRAVRAQRGVRGAQALASAQRGHLSRGHRAAAVDAGGPASRRALLRPARRADRELQGHRGRDEPLLPRRLSGDRAGRRRGGAPRSRRRRRGGHRLLRRGGARRVAAVPARPASPARRASLAGDGVVATAVRRAGRPAPAGAARSRPLRRAQGRIGGAAPRARPRGGRRIEWSRARAAAAPPGGGRGSGAGGLAPPDLRGSAWRRRAGAPVRARRRRHAGRPARAPDQRTPTSARGWAAWTRPIVPSSTGRAWRSSSRTCTGRSPPGDTTPTHVRPFGPASPAAT